MAINGSYCLYVNVELGSASDGFLEESNDIDSSYVGTSKALRPENSFELKEKQI
jgi:hypothetical protein